MTSRCCCFWLPERGERTAIGENSSAPVADSLRQIFPRSPSIKDGRPLEQGAGRIWVSNKGMLEKETKLMEIIYRSWGITSPNRYLFRSQSPVDCERFLISHQAFDSTHKTERKTKRLRQTIREATAKRKPARGRTHRTQATLQHSTV